MSEDEKISEPDKSHLFQPGNELWKNRKSHGRHLKFESADQLYEECVAYFAWVDDNPMWEHKGYGTGLVLKIPKKRYPTIEGLCIHLGIRRKTFLEYQAENHAFEEVAQYADEVIRNMKIEGAAAGFFNQLIVARDIGLKEQTSVDTTAHVTVIDNFDADEQPE